jgi:molybdate transport system substrate-binding protein
MQRMTAALATILLLGTGMARSADQPRTLTVFAAVSVTDVLQSVGDEFTKQTQTPIRFSFAASSALARQIESGAAADVFVSADQEWMDYLHGKQLIDPATRRNILANRLALVAPADSTIALKIAPGFGLVAALGANGRLATGDPDSVPVGKYAKASLTTLGVWKEVEPRLVRAENVRAALAFIARGEVPLGIVYATDARVEPKVRVVDLFPESTHPPITYPAAATKTASPQARAFVEFLGSSTAKAIYERAGFRTFTQPR